jgi:DNA (cytosine-5)-methyltransferase 1
MNELALFAGAGGGILGGQLLGWRTVCAVEWEPYPASVLVARQNDGLLPHFPIWDDVQTFDGKPWRGIVDVISGGFPCQDISCAGKGAGITGKRSGMWTEFARIISEVRPQYVFVENSPMLTSRGLGTVLGDLSEMGFDAEWGVLSAADVGANHKRERIWIVAEQRDFLSYAEHDRLGRGEQQSQSIEKEDGYVAYSVPAGERGVERKGKNESHVMAYSNSTQCERNQCSERVESEYANIGSSSWWATEPNVGRVADGVAARMDRLKAIGNGQVPLCAATAFKLLKERIGLIC